MAELRHSPIILELNTVECSASRPCRLTPREKADGTHCFTKQTSKYVLLPINCDHIRFQTAQNIGTAGYGSMAEFLCELTPV
jgi:hypothetical protein